MTMDVNEFERLIRIEAKLDTMGEAFLSLTGRLAKHESRLDSLDRLRDKLQAIALASGVCIGLIAWSATAYANHLIDIRLADKDFLQLVCVKYKNGRRIPSSELPMLCR